MSQHSILAFFRLVSLVTLLSVHQCSIWTLKMQIPQLHSAPQNTFAFGTLWVRVVLMLSVSSEELVFAVS